MIIASYLSNVAYARQVVFPGRSKKFRSRGVKAMAGKVSLDRN